MGSAQRPSRSRASADHRANPQRPSRIFGQDNENSDAPVRFIPGAGIALAHPAFHANRDIELPDPALGSPSRNTSAPAAIRSRRASGRARRPRQMENDFIRRIKDLSC